MRFLRLIICSFLLASFSFSLQAIDPPTLVWPKNDMIVHKNHLLFQWNTVEGAESYEFQMATDDQFNNIVWERVGVENEIDSLFQELPYGRYFWRVRAFEQEIISSPWSNIYFFDFFSPKALDDLVLWLAADSLVTLIDNKVAQWSDLSGNNFHAIQGNVNNRPGKINSFLINNAAISFNGLNTFLLSNIGELYTQPNSFFLLWENSGPGNLRAFAFDGIGERNSVYYDSNQRIFLFAGSAGQLGFQKTAPFSPILTSAIYNSGDSEHYENGILKASGNPGSNGISEIRIGSHNNNINWLNGNIGELVFFNKLLTTEERTKIEKYLFNKFSPPVNLGFDKYFDRFCPVEINAGNYFQSYSWSTGENSSSIIVSEPGLYFVDVVDQFGKASSDTIKVSFPNTGLNANDQIICAGESLLIFPEISNPQLYSYEWNTGDTSSSLEVTEPGDYWVKITDNAGCFSFSDTITVSVDQFPNEFSLGEDLEVCSGLIFEALPGENTEDFIFLWSTGSTDPFIILEESGAFNVTITNSNGCQAFDEIFVSIVGQAPVVFFGSEEIVCAGYSTDFNDYSSPSEGDEIIEWFWDFGNGNSSTEQNPAYIFDNEGIYNVSLTVTTSSGCYNTFSKEINVFPSPDANFSIPEACAGYPAFFFDESNVPENMEIDNWIWDFGTGDVSSLQNPEYIFDDSGQFNVSLFITLTNGCSDNFETTVNILNSAALPSDLSLILPKNNQLVSSDVVELNWNFPENGFGFLVEISESLSFNDLIFSQVTYSNQLSVSLPNQGDYFWRVNAFNVCRDTISSEISHFTSFLPGNIPNLKLWLAADSMVVTQDGFVSQWSDISGNSFHAVQNNSTNRPFYNQIGLGGKPVIQFNGSNNFLVSNFQDLFLQPNTIFIVWNTLSDSSIRNFVIDGINSSERHGLYYRENLNIFIMAPNATTVGYGKSAPFNFILSTAVYNEANSNFFENGLLRNSGDVGSNATSGLRIGSQFSGQDWLNGNIAEILFFNSLLSDQDREKVEKYLMTKYSPPVNLGADKRTVYGFCPVVLDAGERFESYLWSTGETTSSITVNTPGTYSVTVTDVFGFVSSDEVVVSYPIFDLNVEETTICLGDEIVLGMEQPQTSQLLNFSTPQLLNASTPYSFLWNTGDTTASITVSEEGIYSLLITDTLGCSRELSAIVHVDRFSEQASLGEDRPFCLGAELELQVQSSKFKVQSSDAAPDSPFGGGRGEVLSIQNTLGNKSISYAWNTGETTPTIIINEPGDYSVIAINENGCIATDTVSLSFQGYNPEPYFEVEPTCPGEEMEFIDLSSVAEGEIVSWAWDFGDGGTSSEQNPLHVLEREPGLGEVALAVTTDAGCVDVVSLPVRVYFEPEVYFTPNNACHNVPTLFSDESSDPDGFGLSSWEWDFGPYGSSHQQDAELSFPEPGSFPVSLAVTSVKGCSSALTREVTVRQSPDIAFEWTTACVGEPIAFADLGIQPPWITLTSRSWDFGDGTSSDQMNPTHLYPDDGIYPVTLTLGALNGCVISLTREVTVHSLPEADFAASDLCARAPHTFLDLSSVENSSLAQWQWSFGTLGSSSAQHPVFTFPEPGSFPVTLGVTSAAGCTGSTTKMIQVNPLPEAAFSFSPRYGVAPLNVTFTNTSQGAATYVWDFGDGSAPVQQPSPTHTYTANGIYYPSLVAYTTFGCPDTTQQEIKVIPLSVDIAVTRVDYSIQGGFMEVSANLLNLGTRELDTLWLDLHLDGRDPLRETWTGLLRGGDITTYTFRAQFPVSNINEHDFLCVRASVPNHQSEIVNLQSLIEDLPPTPSPETRQASKGGVDPQPFLDLKSEIVNHQSLIESSEVLASDLRCLTFNDQFRVLEPRPNPAFSEVTVPFILPYEGPVQVTLYDAFGSILIQRETPNAPAGLNFITLPVHNLRGGSYYVRVLFRENVGVKKVMKL